MADHYMNRRRPLAKRLYTKPIPEADLGWMAGFFEGEGHAGIARPVGKQVENGLQVRAVVANTELTPLEFTQSYFGGRIRLNDRSGSVSSSGHPHRKDCHLLQMDGARAYIFCLRIRPYLHGVKEQQVDNLIAAYEEHFPSLKYLADMPELF